MNTRTARYDQKVSRALYSTRTFILVQTCFLGAVNTQLRLQSSSLIISSNNCISTPVISSSSSLPVNEHSTDSAK